VFDLWIGDVNVAPFIWIFILTAVLPVQLVLCFKVKSKIVRLLPAMIFAVLAAASAIAVAVKTDWSALFYLICAVYLAIMLFVCGIGWGIWAIVRKRTSTRIKTVEQ